MQDKISSLEEKYSKNSLSETPTSRDREDMVMDINPHFIKSLIA